ncbi:hypothetical protein V7S43_014624 [Phytophthora oleae]|uniref:BED-type domain-containing protein n=1 Tax=Phytophthora oleae TaxID=2107226 RepID=A0ABD3F483_9STRA
MRKLPSAASASNLRQLVDSATDVVISTGHGSSMLMPPTVSDAGSNGILSHNNMSSSNVAMPDMRLNMDVNMQQPAAPDANMSMATPSTSDHGSKKSLAYLHTKFHEVMTDDNGKTFERRMCNYCDAAFSFKGGTTSAALRHIKTAHPEKLVFNVDNVVPTNATMEEQGDFPGVDTAAQCALTTLSSAANTVNLTVDERVVSSSTAISEEDIHRIRNDTIVDVTPATPANSSVNESEEESSVQMTALPRDNQQLAIQKRKREDTGYGDEGRQTRDGKVSRVENSNLTASQAAILHFRHHYVNELPQPSMRLRLAKHLTHNVAEAEMYNVLDPATQLDVRRDPFGTCHHSPADEFSWHLESRRFDELWASRAFSQHLALALISSELHGNQRYYGSTLPLKLLLRLLLLRARGEKLSASYDGKSFGPSAPRDVVAAPNTSDELSQPHCGANHHYHPSRHSPSPELFSRQDRPPLLCILALGSQEELHFDEEETRGSLLLLLLLLLPPLDSQGMSSVSIVFRVVSRHVLAPLLAPVLHPSRILLRINVVFEDYHWLDRRRRSSGIVPRNSVYALLLFGSWLQVDCVSVSPSLIVYSVPFSLGSSSRI